LWGVDAGENDRSDMFGTVNAFVPIPVVSFMADLSAMNWGILVPMVVLITVSSTFPGCLLPFRSGKSLRLKPLLGHPDNHAAHQSVVPLAEYC